MALRRTLLLIVLVIAARGEATACNTVCIPPHNELVQGYYLVGQPPGGTGGVRLAGFGVAVADQAVANCAPGENPGFNTATLTWKDFRFYVKVPDLPGTGFVKGTLNKEKTSAVLLTANNFAGNGGLFPASLTNRVYLRLLPVDWPGVEYRNAMPVTMYTPQTFSAPPDSSVITHQQGETIFTSVGLQLPGFPSGIGFSGGEQMFLDPAAIELSLLSTTGGIVRVQLTNPLSENLWVAYFLHVDDVEPLADQVETMDGVRNVPAQGQAVLSFNLDGIPVGSKAVTVDAMVLDPMNVAGHDRLTFHLGASSGSNGPVSEKPAAAPVRDSKAAGSPH